MTEKKILFNKSKKKEIYFEYPLHGQFLESHYDVENRVVILHGNI